MAIEAVRQDLHWPWNMLESSSTDGATMPHQEINRKVGRRGHDGGGSSPSTCLTNNAAYRYNGCCAGACGDTYDNCFDCPTTQEQDPVNYGGPSCFRNGSCIAEAPIVSDCAAPSEKQPRGESAYGGWCMCSEGSFCRGDGCSNTAARGLWNPDEVSMAF